ncbi:MAG: hypothetical protein E5V95_33310 [Mesorhizobium sp.]|uniref:hypothetical protein n=1 Tax=Mesorhizobium sp. TaxID=1871066 RepID=UPI0011F574E1|nr:hypothetical protein [Mesorhizobium sp.]TIV13667.1 MAG: hypothetical protein E5V95_33310 [Mesorhizobium sp.]
MSVAQELKLKRAELTNRLEDLAKLQAEVREQVSSIDKVIAIYEPGYGPMPAKARRPGRTTKISDEVKASMGGVNQRQVVLEILRESANPVSTSECAAKFSHAIGLGGEAEIVDQVSRKLSAVLTQLTKAGRVRHVGKAANRQFLWEIAA